MRHQCCLLVTSEGEIFICSMGKVKQNLSCDHFFHKFERVLFGLQKKQLNKTIYGSDTGSDYLEMSGLT